MESNILEIVAAIDSIVDVDEVESLTRLRRLSIDFLQCPNACGHLDVWLRLYERFPEAEGYGVLWLGVHVLESYPRNESMVIESVRRCPTQFTVMMIHKMLSRGLRNVGDIDLLGVLEEVTIRQQCGAVARRDAKDFLALHRGTAVSGVAIDGEGR